MKIAIVKYNSGNVFSVKCALNRIGVEAEVTDDIDTLCSADKVIFPGVGNAASAMEYLKSKGLDKVIKGLKQPVLGICLGLQLLCKKTEEGDVEGLGIFDAKVRRFSNEHELSGGEQQRIVIARALLNEPKLVLADEPTGNLDPETGHQIVSLLREISENGTTVIMATHNIQMTEEFPSRVLKCVDKKLVDGEK